MYFSNIFNTEVEKVAKTRKFDSSIPLSDISDDVWVIESHTSDVKRIFPLFRCDELVSSNNDDVIIEDNQCMVCQVDDETIININSGGETKSYYGVNLFLTTPVDDFDSLLDGSISCFVDCVDYNNNVIADLDLVLQISYNNTNWSDLASLVSDSDGKASFEFDFDEDTSFYLRVSHVTINENYKSNVKELSWTVSVEEEETEEIEDDVELETVVNTNVAEL